MDDRGEARGAASCQANDGAFAYLNVTGKVVWTNWSSFGARTLTVTCHAPGCTTSILPVYCPGLALPVSLSCTPVPNGVLGVEARARNTTTAAPATGVPFASVTVTVMAFVPTWVVPRLSVTPMLPAFCVLVKAAGPLAGAAVGLEA